MLFEEETIRAAADAEGMRHLSLITLRLETGGQHDHVGEDLLHLAGIYIPGSHPELANLPLRSGIYLQVTVEANEAHPFVLHAPEKVFVAFAEGAHVAVELDHLRLDGVAD